MQILKLRIIITYLVVIFPFDMMCTQHYTEQNGIICETYYTKKYNV